MTPRAGLVAWVALGGALGSVCRWLLTVAVHRSLSPSAAPGGFPYGTFVVNVAGCALFGLLAGLDGGRWPLGPAARGFLLVGLLGGFTTFSSFGWETFDLLRQAQVGRALANISGQVLLGLLGLWLGYAGARLLA